VGLAFVAPTLIYHYVEAHGYFPPEAFIEAVMQDNPENAETAAERYRFGATILSRIALDFLEMQEKHKPRH
jgi:DNA gyrase inhibitor GyrI